MPGRTLTGGQCQLHWPANPLYGSQCLEAAHCTLSVPSTCQTVPINPFLHSTPAAPNPPSYTPPFQGKRCLISGAGNVAQYCAQLLLEKGAVVLSLSDSKGYVYEPNGFSKNQLEQVQRRPSSLCV